MLLRLGVTLGLPWCLLACAPAPSAPPASLDAPPIVDAPTTAIALAPAPAPLPQAASSAASPPPVAPPSSASPPAVAGPALAGLHATASMKLEGNVDADKVVPAINTQVAGLQRCVALIRTTDKVVGSLNLRITIAQDGKVATELQSPVNASAQRCLLDGARTWSIKGAGAGKAMLLLNLE
jgi:hypothetical protein